MCLCLTVNDYYLLCLKLCLIIDYNIIPIQFTALWLDGGVVLSCLIGLCVPSKYNRRVPAAASSAESISVIGSEAADSLQHFMAVIIHSDHQPTEH